MVFLLPLVSFPVVYILVGERLSIVGHDGRRPIAFHVGSLQSRMGVFNEPEA